MMDLTPYCTACGHRPNPGDTFCGRCGIKRMGGGPSLESLSAAGQGLKVKSKPARARNPNGNPPLSEPRRPIPIHRVVGALSSDDEREEFVLTEGPVRWTQVEGWGIADRVSYVNMLLAFLNMFGPEGFLHFRSRIGEAWHRGEEPADVVEELRQLWEIPSRANHNEVAAPDGAAPASQSTSRSKGRQPIPFRAVHHDLTSLGERTDFVLATGPVKRGEFDNWGVTDKRRYQAQMLDFLTELGPQGFLNFGVRIRQAWSRGERPADVAAELAQHWKIIPLDSSQVQEPTPPKRAIARRVEIPLRPATSPSSEGNVALILGFICLVAWLIPLAGIPLAIVTILLAVRATQRSASGAGGAAIVLGSIGAALALINAAGGAYLAGFMAGHG